MVELQCPHCEEDIELDDDAYGLFDCPYCDEEFEWEEPPKPKNKRKSKITKPQSKFKKQTEKKDVTTKKKIVSSQTGPLFDLRQVVMMAFTFLMIIILFIGLSSNSWYYIDDSDSESESDWSYESEEEMNFGLNNVETYTYRITRVDGDEEIGESTGSVHYYGLLDNYKKTIENMQEALDECKETIEEWGGNKSDCVEMYGEGMNEAEAGEDWWGKWSTSGFLLKIIIICSLLSLMSILTMKITVLLDEAFIIQLPENFKSRFKFIDRMLIQCTGALLILGCLMYALFIPSLGDSQFTSMFPDGTDNMDSGMGLMWWTTLIMSLSYLSTSLTLSFQSE